MERHDLPRTPRSIEELAIPVGVVHDLAMRRALYEGRTSTVRLSEGLGVSMAIMSKVVEELRDLRLIDLLGMEGRDYIFDLTEQGRDHARERASLCRYAGYAPVSIAEYNAMVLRQAAPPEVTRETMHRAFADLVVSNRLIDELGPALLTEGAMFLYGPPGTGKTSVAERLIRTHVEPVLVPRCVEIDSQIITVFDPLVHEPVDEQPKELDPRWVLCRRPSIVAGGELTSSMMDLTFEPNSGVYLAPIQMQANNGLLVIDDFGRQGISPEALLNRWIVPLDRRIDFLSLTYGVRFEVPFDVKVVFSTNLDPSTLGDEAFFRRIQNKILVSSISDAEFDAVLTIAAANSGIAITPGAPDHLRHVSRELGDGDLRPYLPKEVCKILKAVCQFNHVPLVLDNDGVDRVAAIYFTRAGELRSAEAEAASAAGQFVTGGSFPPPAAAPAAQAAPPAHAAPAHVAPPAPQPAAHPLATPPGTVEF